MAGLRAGEPIRLIVRGDDLGMTQGSLLAFERAFNEGILTSGALVVPGPWFEAAAEMCRKNPGWSTGVHLCLVGEWRGYRWRPVLPWDRVSSLVDEDGYLFTSPDELFSHRPKLEEIDRELRAQIDLARKKGVHVQYLDTHYITPSNETYPGLGDLLQKIAADYDLPFSGNFGEKEISVYETPIDQKVGRALELVDSLTPGLWLWICHIGIDSPEQRALIHTARNDIFVTGGVGRHRAAEFEVLTSLELRSALLKKGIELISYSRLWKEKGH